MSIWYQVNRWALLLLFLTGSPVWAGDNLPASMLIDGKIDFRLSLPPVFPHQGDIVVAFSQQDGQLLGQGAVTNGDGHYVVELLLNSSFNQTAVSLEIQKGRTRYRLLDKGRPLEFVFQGGVLPRRLSLNPKIGEVSAILPDIPPLEGATRTSQNPSTTCDLASMDVNQDGLCNDDDLAILGLFGGGVTRTMGGVE